MKHLFATGEILYKKNVKALSEGDLIAESLEYEKVAENEEYTAVGTIRDKKVSVKFKINSDDYSSQNLIFKFTVKILMQSDLLIANWDNYIIEYI